MTAIPEFQTSRLSIRHLSAVTPQDMVRYVTENLAFHAPFVPKPSEASFTEAHWQTQILNAKTELDADTAARFVLVSLQEDGVVGTANLSQIFRGAFQAAYLGFGLAQTSQGKGLMHEALVPILDYAFARLKLHRIMANHLLDNQRSANLLKRLGFEVEGIAKQYLKINDRWQDHVLTSLTSPFFDIKGSEPYAGKGSERTTPSD